MSKRTADDAQLENQEDTRPPCEYGMECYRKNPNHFWQFRHPEDHPYIKEHPEFKDDRQDERKAIYNSLLDKYLRNPSQVASWKLQKRLAEESKDEKEIAKFKKEPERFRACWIPQYEPLPEGMPSDPLVSKSGGLPFLSADEEWPVCGCEDPLHFFFQLHFKDLPSELKGVHCVVTEEEKREKGEEAAILEAQANQILQMFWCPECSENDFGIGQLVRIVDLRKKQPKANIATKGEFFKELILTGFKKRERDICGFDDEIAFPYGTEEAQENPELPQDLKGINWGEVSEEFTDDDEMNPESGDKLSGFPCFVQGPEYGQCPKCKKQAEEEGGSEEDQKPRYMHLLYQTNGANNKNDEDDDFSFGDCGIGHVWQCPIHRDQVGFGWACS